MKKKRLLSLVMALAMTFGAASALPQSNFTETASISASAEEYYEENWGYNYNQNNSVTLYNYFGDKTDLTIPSVFMGLPVTCISGTFQWYRNLESVIIPDSIIEVLDNCFAYNSKIKSVDIPNSVTSIGDGVFFGCTNLASVTIPNSVTSIGDEAFSHCSSLSSVTIPSSVTSIGWQAFKCCTSLTSITIPTGVTSIGDGAFYGCESLTSVTIPSSITSIGSHAFKYCTSLTSITIPTGVTSIGDGAFYGCESLTSVTIPNNVTTIGEGAFNGCESLTSITIPNSVTWIKDCAFLFCNNSLVLKVFKDSYAEQYAKDNDIKYEYIDGGDITEDDSQFITTTDVEFRYGNYGETPKDYSFYYSDAMLVGKGSDANKESADIAKFSANLAVAAYEKDSILKCLKTMGFKSNNIKYADTYEFMPTYEDNDRVAYTIAYKKVNGKDLFVVPIRGTHGNCEWFSDFNLGTGDDTEGYHKGFYLAANRVKTTLLSEMRNRNVKSENVVLYFTGHSRGAAVANILAGEFSTNAMDLNGYSVDVPTNQIFAYTYACPAVSKTLTSKDTALKNIYNYINPGDLIPALPLEEKGWDYKRYGQKIPYSLSGDTFYDFLHRFYEFYRNEDGEKEYYKGLAKTDQVIAVFKTIASTPKEYNKPNNRALFDFLCLNLMNDSSKYIPSTKDELKEQIAKRYNTSISTLVESTSKLMGAIGMIASPQMAFNGITLFNLGDAITHGHTGETYVKWTEAMYDTRTNLSHEYDPVKTGFWVGLGYSSYRCKICGKENVINYQPAAVENVVKNVEKDLNLTFHRCDEDEKTYGLFKSVEVDGKTLDPSNYSAKSGSLKLTFDKSFVSKLSAGTHNVKVLFEDGFSESNIFVAESSKDPMVDRLAGKGRYETAAKISNKAYGFETASTVVLAYGLNYADALAGVSLAKAMNAPILLTNLKTLPNETLVEIKRLGASNVIILGGTGAVGEEVEKILKENNLNVERIAGKTRFETATKIAQKMQKLNDNKAPKEVFFVYAFNSADALSVSAVAAVKGAPVIYLKTNGELDDATANYLKSVKGSVKNAYVIGGSGVISDDMMKKAGKALSVTPTRVFGKDRFATCVAVNEQFKDTLNGDMLCVATGMDFPDALAGGVYAAINKAPLFLVNGKLKTPKLTDEQKAYLKAKSAAKITAFGGVGVVPDNHIADIAKNSV